MKIPYMKKPCDNCPFRKDESGIKGLGGERAKEIAKQNARDGFVCHKTVDYDKEQGEVDEKRRQCAGALILAQKTKTEQPFLALYDILVGGELELLDKEVIVDSYEEFIKIQS